MLQSSIASTTFIYALCCPLTGAVRYIGKSDVPATRLYEHTFGNRYPRSSLTRWIKALRAQGYTPTLKIVEEVPITEWKSAERRYIQQAKDAGLSLLNATLGGEGFDGGAAHPHFGIKRSLEFREKQRKAKLGKPRPPWIIEKLRLHNTGRKLSPEVRAAMSRSRLGRKLTGSESRFVGVSWDNGRWLWLARIPQDGCLVNLGRFALEVDAALAFDRAAEKLNRKTNDALGLFADRPLAILRQRQKLTSTQDSASLPLSL